MKRLKRSDTGIRVLQVLQELMNKALSVEEIITFLKSKDENEYIYTNETVVKYITTIRAFGLDVVKKDKKFYLKNFPAKTTFSFEELKNLKKLEEYILRYGNQKTYEEFFRFISNLEKCFDAKTCEIFNTYFADFKTEKVVKTNKDKKLIDNFEKLCRQSQKLVIKYKDFSTEDYERFLVEPKNIKLISNRAFLQAYCPKSEEVKLFLLNNISHYEQAPQCIRTQWHPTETIFKLKAKMAQSYKLRLNEELIYFQPEEIIIKNKDEDKELLMRRLLRYGTFCEILKPIKSRKMFIDMVDKAISNYS